MVRRRSRKPKIAGSNPVRAFCISVSKALNKQKIDTNNVRQVKKFTDALMKEDKRDDDIGATVGN